MQLSTYLTDQMEQTKKLNLSLHTINQKTPYVDSVQAVPHVIYFWFAIQLQTQECQRFCLVTFFSRLFSLMHTQNWLGDTIQNVAFFFL